MPGSMLEVVGVLSQGDLTMVHLREVETPLSFNEFPPKPAGSSAPQGVFIFFFSSQFHWDIFV